MAKKEKEEKPKEVEKTPKEAAEAAVESPAPAKEVQPLEANYPEGELKSGEVYLKRKNGKPRIRKIVSKNHQAQLFMHDRGKWTQKSALTVKGKPIHDLRWHLRNKWEKVDKAQFEK